MLSDGKLSRIPSPDIDQDNNNDNLSQGQFGERLIGVPATRGKSDPVPNHIDSFRPSEIGAAGLLRRGSCVRRALAISLDAKSQVRAAERDPEPFERGVVQQ